MFIVKILKRRDAASVVLAIIVGLIINSLVMSLSAELSARLSGTNTLAHSYPFKSTYLMPIVSVIVQLLILEVLARAYVWAHDMMNEKK